MVIIFSKDFHLSMEIKKEYIWCLIGEQFLLKLLWKCTYVNSDTAWKIYPQRIHICLHIDLQI